MPALFNEIDPFAAQWTRNLAARGLIAPGLVDERSIADLQPTDLVGVEQFHTFSGIAIWSYALRRAGVPDDANVWTGSAPCQPFSDAGAKKGFSDDRHLWPEWFRLIRECRPAVVFGEQIAGPLGRAWLDVVFADLESAGYACGSTIISAAGVGAPHQRHRIYFVAYASGVGLGERFSIWLHEERKRRNDSARCGAADFLGDAASARREVGDLARGADRAEGAAEAAQGRRSAGVREPERTSDPGISDSALVDASRDGDREHPGELPGDEVEHVVWPAYRDHAPIPAGATRGFWADAKWVWCRDERYRPVSPSGRSFPLAPGPTNRVEGMRRRSQLRGYGNGLCAEAAVAFIEASLDAICDVSAGG